MTRCCVWRFAPWSSASEDRCAGRGSRKAAFDRKLLELHVGHADCIDGGDERSRVGRLGGRDLTIGDYAVVLDEREHFVPQRLCFLWAPELAQFDWDVIRGQSGLGEESADFGQQFDIRMQRVEVRVRKRTVRVDPCLGARTHRVGLGDERGIERG
jgi:hypothetical protein